MNTTIRFALIGKSGSGKSTVSSIMREERGLTIVKTGAICRKIANLLFGNENKSTTQLLDDVLTGLDPSIFLKAAVRDLPDRSDFVIDALRFHSDFTLARELGCSIIRVVSDDAERVRRLEVRGQAFELQRDGLHRSERELDDVPVDYEIANTGTLNDIRSSVAVIMASVSK
jgi:dephospho-CoA kinase